MIAHLDAKTRELLCSFNSRNPVTENAVRDWYRMFPDSVFRNAASDIPYYARQCVYPLMISDEACCLRLCNPALFDAAGAIRIAREILVIAPTLDLRLAKTAMEWARNGRHPKPLHRCLEILDATMSGGRINSAIVQLLHAGNGAVRSKVIDILVRSTTNEANIREWLRDPDPRIRANALEALGTISTHVKWCRPLLLEYLEDPDGRASANTAIALFRIGIKEPAIARLSEMALSREAALRVSAAWAMGQTPDERLFELLNQLRSDSDSRVKWHALRSLAGFKRAGIKAKPATPAVLVQEPPAEPVVGPVSEPVLPEPKAHPLELPKRHLLRTSTFGDL